MFTPTSYARHAVITKHRTPKRRVSGSAIIAAAALLSSGTLGAQGTAANNAVTAQQLSGPVIQSAGMSYKVENPTFAIPDGHVFKALFVINVGGGDSIKVNEQLTTVARLYNLHANNGVPESRVRAAAVFHGTGWTALLTDSAFAARYGGKPNPSKRLVEELIKHGAQLILCGQTGASRGIRREELLPGVQVAISAMTAFNVLQAQGYQYNPW